MKIVIAFFVTLSFFILQSCEKDKNELDSITVNYQKSQTLSFGGGHIEQYKDSIVMGYKIYVEQTLLSSDIISDSTFLKFETKYWQWSPQDSLFLIDTILISKAKYYQLQSHTTTGTFGLSKIREINSDTTKIPFFSGTQYPLHPVILKEGENLKVYRPDNLMFLHVEREFQVKEIKTIGTYKGIYVLGVNNLDSKYIFPFRYLFNADGKLISEFDFGENVKTDPVGNEIARFQSYQISNRIGKQSNPFRYLAKLKPSDLTRLF